MVAQESRPETQARRHAYRLVKLIKDGHILDNVYGDFNRGSTTRRQLASFSSHHAFISHVEP